MVKDGEECSIAKAPLSIAHASSGGASRMRREHEKKCPFSFPSIAVSVSKAD